MKLATDEDLLPNRNRTHKYMAEPLSCENCGGRGYHDDEFGQLYCNCAAGIKRQGIESDDESNPNPKKA